MSIELVCSQCGSYLRVPDDAAGQRARCPACGNVFAVPSAADQPAAGPLWHVQLPGGRHYGPVSKAELDAWAAEDRIGPDTMLRLDGQDQWVSAAHVYPWLAQPAQAAATQPFTSSQDSAELNPYASPATSIGTHLRPHHGGLVLTLGILALCCNVCLIPGICAWALGQQDLAAMRTGQMDPSGQTITQVGMILGIVGTALGAFGILLQMLMLGA